METAADVGASAPASESFVADTPITEAPEAAAPSIDEDLRGIWDKNHPPRENGRFVSKNPTEQPAAEAEAPVTENAVQSAETVVEQAQKPAIDAPVSWTAEQKAKWATLPPDTQAYIAQRDKESHEAISRAGQQIKAFEPIGEVIKHYSHVFEKNGLQPHDGIARMMAVNEMLETNPRAAIAEIAKAYGVNLQGTTDGQDASPEHPRIAELEARLARQEAHLTAQERQKQQAEYQKQQEADAALAREIADFAKDKPHFESVRQIMAGLAQTLPPDLSPAEMRKHLEDIYDKACFADPTIRQSKLVEQQTKAEEQRKAEEAKRVSAAKKAAGVNVKSSTAHSNGPKSMDDELWQIARKHYGT
jgi:hypothetical protein